MRRGSVRWTRMLPALALVAALIGASPVASAAAPAPAHEPYYFDRTAPVGFVSDGIRHVAVVRERYQSDEVWLLIDDLEADIDLPDPAGDGNQAIALAADEDGNLTVAVKAASGPKLWFTRYGPDGAQLAPAVEVEASEVPYRGLADGSVLTTTSFVDGDVVWRSSTGVEQARFDLSPSGLRSTAVDRQGRLLTTSAAGLERRAPGAVPDLTVDEDCDATFGYAVLLDPSDGFATACGTATPSGDATMTVTRYAETGEEDWSITTEPAEYGIVQPTGGAIDGLGQMWISGGACSDPAPTTGGGRCSPIYSVLGRYDQGGRSPDPTEAKVLEDGGVPRFHGDEVFWAASHPPDVNYKGFWTDGWIYTFTMPEQPSAPTCTAGDLVITGAAARSATLRFDGCGAYGFPFSDQEPTRFRVEALESDGRPAASVDVPQGPTRQLSGTVSGLEGGVRYRLRVRAENEAGAGQWSWLSASMTPPFTSLPAFVDRQYRDLVGRAPTQTELSNATALLDFQNETPAGQVDRLLGEPWSGPNVDPMVRLYRAYFLRNPDSGGLRSWVGKRRAGMTLSRISQSFATSSEFTRRYGSLGNKAFVELVYQNVLGRPGEASGVDYWTRRLDQRRMSRGQVMLQFSESPEFTGKSRPEVDVVAVTFGLLQRSATAAESSTWAPQFRSGTPRSAFVAVVLGSTAYANRVR